MNSFILKFYPARLIPHPMVAVCAVGLLLLFFLPSSLYTRGGAAAFGTDEMDAGLRRAASLALGEREGTIIVLDAQTGRVRAVVNPRMAAQKAYAPGSTIKPFAALAALKAGLINKDSRLLCREHYRRGDFEISCSHPKEQPPFNPEQALAYSCNYYFGELGERLSAETFKRTLLSFGFGSPTGFAPNEVTGELPSGGRVDSNALGEGDGLLVTPMQLATAYAALVNGGHLFAAQEVTATGFAPRERARVDIAAPHREILLEGMRGAVEYGTASEAGLAGLPLKIFGKTGTSTASDDGGRTQGWFVGIAADESAAKATSSAAQMKLVVLVFLKRSHGDECAEASRVVFEEFARMGSRGDKEARVRGDIEQVAAHARLTNAQTRVRVHLVRENVTKTMAFEDYVLGVVAAEGSIEDELESLKALSVASRTYALKNLHRHARDNYDFCTTTHCQRYIPVNREEVREQISRAVAETQGEILRDAGGEVVESYFSASCGGMTADVQKLWGAAPKSYLRGMRDEYCKEMPHSHWTDTIPAEKLAQALHGDQRSDVGARVDEVRILKKDQTGRAELMEVAGERRRTLRGWDFKIIVGRALGWNLLKSSRFEVTREGENFVFRGSGFGHGLGLCQEGAHVMAAGGTGYRQILAKYFPGTMLRKEIGNSRA
ncbi:MAG: SpoIID/LytB domain-containing protein [Pyrinomonadaceae bacterium]|nr:SpoIID/LytB domain-containing protein [Pyrinomonadaceae bacterium]